MKGVLGTLAVLLLLALLGCDPDEEVTYKTENCAAATAMSGEGVLLCCQVRCTAAYDYDDYTEQCTEATTCTTATGATCAPSLALAVRPPVCLY